jgi:hypothetical protein
MLTIDARCNHPRCNEKNIYRMVGSCRNCHTEDILVLYSAAHDSMGTYGWDGHPCPVCGVRQVRVSRLATPDEIPVS